jgi:ATP-dependent Lhr-like helicase
LEAPADQEENARENNICWVMRGWVECSGPLTATELVRWLGIARDDIVYALACLENEGVVLRGSFRTHVEEEEFCDRRILSRIHRSTIDTLRREVEPISSSAFIRFLLRWQHVDPAVRLQGEGGLLTAIEQLQGFESASGALEDEVLLSRVSDYSPVMLDRLCLGGEVLWGRVSLQASETQNRTVSPLGRTAFSRATPITMVLRDSLDWILGPTGQDAEGLTGATKEVVEFLNKRGASFLSDIVSATQRLPSDVEEALWTLAASGKVTVDGVEALRQRLGGTARRPRPNGRNVRPNSRPNLNRRRGYSRWSLLEPFDPVDDRSEPIARQLLGRYGVIFPELLARDALTYRWRDLVRVCRRLEARGEIRGGRFVSGFIGEQFALPEAVELLRKTKNAEPDGRFIAISACDPLNLAGILSPGHKVPAVLRNRLVFRDGVSIVSMENGSVVELTNASPDIMERAKVTLSVPISHAGCQMGKPDLVTV